MNAMEKIMKAMPANTTSAKNLNPPQCIRILLDGKASLEEQFAEIDVRLVRTELKNLSINSDKVPSRIRKLIERTDFPKRLVRAITG